MITIKGNPITQGKSDPLVNTRTQLSRQIGHRIMDRPDSRTSQIPNWSHRREVGTNPRTALAYLISIVWLEFLQPPQLKVTTPLEADPAPQRDLESILMPHHLIRQGSEPKLSVILRL